MPHLAEEAALMMSNLIPFLRYKYGDGVLHYFTAEAKAAASEDKWDPEQGRVISGIDTNAELEEEMDTIGFIEAKKNY